LNTIRIMSLAALTLLSVVPMVKPAPPTLTIQFSSQPVTFASWNTTIVFSNSSTFLCSTGLTIPGTLVINGLNFTENLSGRDPGSTWVHFRSLNGGPALFSKEDVTVSLITAFLCGSNVSLNKEKALLGPDSNWRVVSSGNYTLLGNYIIYTTPPSTIPISEVANDTWTVSKIS
jgi:hypothetical protein